MARINQVYDINDSIKIDNNNINHDNTMITTIITLVIKIQKQKNKTQN